MPIVPSKKEKAAALAREKYVERGGQFNAAGEPLDANLYALCLDSCEAYVDVMYDEAGK